MSESCCNFKGPVLLLCGMNGFTLTDQAILPSPQFLFPPFLTYNLQLCISFISLPPAPLHHSILHSVTPLFLQPLSWALIRSSVSLSACHSLLYAPHPPAPSLSLSLAAIRQAAFFSVLRYCYSLPLHNSLALPFKLCFLFSQIASSAIFISASSPSVAHSLSLPLFHLFNLLLRSSSVFRLSILNAGQEGSSADHCCSKHLLTSN